MFLSVMLASFIILEMNLYDNVPWARGASRESRKTWTTSEL